MGDARPGLEYLVACSDMSLESFQMSRMNQAANLQRQIRTLVDQWIGIEVDAGLAGWMLECRRLGTTPPKLSCFPLPRANHLKKPRFLPGPCVLRHMQWLRASNV